MIGRLVERWNDTSLVTRARLVAAIGFCASAVVLLVAIEVASRMPESAPLWPLIAGFGVLAALALTGVFFFGQRQATRVSRLGRIAVEMAQGRVLEPVIAESRDEIGQLQAAMIDASRSMAGAAIRRGHRHSTEIGSGWASWG